MEFYSGETRQSGRFNEEFMLRRSHGNDELNHFDVNFI